ncbi:MAG: element excision factor XisH family protein [Coleofasciculus sp. D1-CHI-01]
MAKDIFHDAVKNGLEKEDWVITDDPMRIRAGRFNSGCWFMSLKMRWF